LKSEHYPRVDDGDKDEILKELKKLVSKKIALTIIGVNPKEGKLIFSEKGNMKEEKKEAATKYSVGDILDTEVSGIVDFGVFSANRKQSGRIGTHFGNGLVIG
jgi:ribosomal protein S1